MTFKSPARLKLNSILLISFKPQQVICKPEQKQIRDDDVYKPECHSFAFAWMAVTNSLVQN